MSDLSFFQTAELDRVVGMLFDLAGQVHVERQRRMALEEVLVREGILDREALDALADDEDFLADVRTQLDGSLDRLFQIVTEDGPPQHPLRNEAPETEATT